MLKKIMTVALVAGLTPMTHANEWKVLPVMSDDYTADFAVALIIGKTDVKDGDDVTTKGVEISLNCPLLKPPHHTIRQQISYTQSDEKGVETTSLEINPHHIFNLNEKLSLGFGPSLGISKVDIGNDDDSVFTYGLGASARYNVTKTLFVSTEARYAWSEDLELSGTESDFENVRLTAKIGYQF